jgi:hypothetical protein
MPGYLPAFVRSDGWLLPPRRTARRCDVRTNDGWRGGGLCGAARLPVQRARPQAREQPRGLVHAPWLGRQPGVSFGRAQSAGSQKEYKGRAVSALEAVALPPLLRARVEAGRRPQGSPSPQRKSRARAALRLGSLPCRCHHGRRMGRKVSRGSLRRPTGLIVQPFGHDCSVF